MNYNSNANYGIFYFKNKLQYLKSVRPNIYKVIDNKGKTIASFYSEIYIIDYIDKKYEISFANLEEEIKKIEKSLLDLQLK